MPKAPLVGELASASETEGLFFPRIYPTLPRSPSSYRQNNAMKGGSPMWELLYETFWDRLEHFCFNLCRDEARAEDLTQEVFLRTESLLRPTPPGGKGGAAAQHLFPGRGPCRTGFRTGHSGSRQSAGSAHPGRAAAVHPALYSGLQCQRDRSAALSPARHGPQPPCPDTPSPQN